MRKEYLYRAFSGYGLELEYMIVDGRTLAVRPIADGVLKSVAPAVPDDEEEDMDVERGDAAWSNELALHVIEMKTLGPTSDLAEAARIFHRQLTDLLRLLEPLGARLMPTGTHPFMDPLSETKLWPHQNDAIYRTFDRIFDCKGHGWSNLQSMHINFPFATEEEFVRVHAACRFVLPLIPALAASSPFQDGRRAAALDARLFSYESNCRRVPAVTGQVIPEIIRSSDDYRALLEGIYRDLAPLDPEGVLAEEWVNARGAIARFDRGAVEIRLCDTQECPEQDMAVALLVTALVEAISGGEFIPFEELVGFPSDELISVYRAARTHASGAAVPSGRYLQALQAESRDFRGVMVELTTRLVPADSPLRRGLDLIGVEGSLAERLVSHVPEETPAPERLHALYAKVCDCLSRGEALCRSS